MARYIDADKLMNFANNSKDKTIDANDIARFPSADVRENVRGEWIDGMEYVNSHWKVCSICHKSAHDSSGGDNFCPNCGADMRERRTDG